MSRSESSSRASTPPWPEVEHHLSEAESNTRGSTPSLPEEEYLYFRPIRKVLDWLRKTRNSYQEDVDGDIIDPNVLVSISPSTSESSGSPREPEPARPPFPHLSFEDRNEFFLCLACVMRLPGADDDGVRSTASSADKSPEWSTCSFELSYKGHSSSGDDS